MAFCKALDLVRRSSTIRVNSTNNSNDVVSPNEVVAVAASSTPRPRRAVVPAVQQQPQNVPTTTNGPASGMPQQPPQVLLTVGQRVHCTWPDETGDYFAGRIGAVQWKSRSNLVTYTVNFDDGDVSRAVKREAILDEEEFAQFVQKYGTQRTPTASPAAAAVDVGNGERPWKRRKDELPPPPEAFMTAPLFYVNSFVASGNQDGFVPFIREQVATIGYNYIPQCVFEMVKNGASTERVRKKILERWSHWGESYLSGNQAQFGAGHVLHLVEECQSRQLHYAAS